MASAVNSERRIALVDVNNFYASCETVFNPKLRGQAVVVLSNNDGCVVARSAEAKALKIKMAQPWHQVPKFIQNRTTVFSSNYALYADMSNRVMTILGDMAPRQEIYSIDESFLDLTGLCDLDARANRIRERVGQWTGLAVCVGIGSTKTRAKLANHIAKKSTFYAGVTNLEALSSADQSQLLQSIPVGDVWGIGFQTERKLVQMGIKTAESLRVADGKRLRHIFGVVVERIVAELNGTSCDELEVVAPARQQIRSSRSFGRPVTELSMLIEAVLAFISIAAEKLRRQGSVASTLQVFICTNIFKPETAQRSVGYTLKLPYATDDTVVLGRLAARVLKQLYAPGFQYKKAGINLMELSPKGSGQMQLLTNADGMAEGDRLSEALDAINRRFGRDTVSLGRIPGNREWSMNQSRLSQHYTTKIDQLLRAY